MKKIIKVWLIILVFCFFINVKAVENENQGPVELPGADIFDDPLAGLCDENGVNVKINGNPIVCNQDSTCEYIIDKNGVDKVLIEYGPACGGELKKEEHDIKTGLNSFPITATSKNGKTYNYTVKITKEPKSTDSTLKKLTINGEAITLKSGTNKYSTTVSFSTNKLEVEAVPSNDYAKIDGANKNKLYFDLFENSKNIQVKVIAESGDVTTYVITVTKREEADTTLKKLTIKGASIDFESEVYDYTLSVFKSVTNLEIEAIPTDSSATVKINKPETLEMGENTVTIEVENDANKKTYTLKITRLDMEDETVANLKSLKIKDYDLNFKEDKYEYDLKIGDVNYLDIDAVPLNKDAEVEITGNVDLVNGSIIKIKVTYNDDITNIYRINIQKDEVVEKDNNTSKIIIIVIITLILIIGIVTLIIVLIKRNKNNPNKKQGKKNKKDNKEKTEVNQSDVVNIDDDDDEIDVVI